MIIVEWTVLPARESAGRNRELPRRLLQQFSVSFEAYPFPLRNEFPHRGRESNPHEGLPSQDCKSVQLPSTHFGEFVREIKRKCLPSLAGNLLPPFLGGHPVRLQQTTQFLAGVIGVVGTGLPGRCFCPAHRFADRLGFGVG